MTTKKDGRRPAAERRHGGFRRLLPAFLVLLLLVGACAWYLAS